MTPDITSIIRPHELTQLKSILKNTEGIAFCPPLRRALLVRIVKAISSTAEPQPAKVEVEEEKVQP